MMGEDPNQEVMKARRAKLREEKAALMTQRESIDKRLAELDLFIEPLDQVIGCWTSAIYKDST